MNNKVKYILVLGAFIILSILGYLLLPRDKIVISEMEETDEFIFVHVEGCVENPGLVKVKYGTRLYELIEEAGGETIEADLTRVNLASIVNDGQKIVIPAKISYDLENEESYTQGVVVNINTASKEKLMTLNGIGESTAEKIIKYREEVGAFNAVEDLMNVPSIGESKFNNIKDDITV